MQQDVELLSLGLGHFEQKLTSQLRKELRTEFVRWQRVRRAEGRAQLHSVPRPARRRYTDDSQRHTGYGESIVPRQLLDFLLAAIPQKVESLEMLRLRHRDFRQTYTLAVTDEERRRLVLSYAKQLGATRRQEQTDGAALDRWFGESAITQRFRRRVGQDEQALAFAMRRLGAVAGFVSKRLQHASDLPDFWQRTRLESAFRCVLRYDGDVRIRRAVFEALADALMEVPRNSARVLISPELRQEAADIASDSGADTWLQVAALEFLCLAAPDVADSVIRSRVSDPQPGDDLFFRRAAVRCLGTRIRENPVLVSELPAVLRDPSDYVRQQLATLTWHLPPDAARYYMIALMRDDESPQVRAAMLASVLDVFRADVQSKSASPEASVYPDQTLEILLEFLQQLAHVLQAELTPVLATERDAFIPRCALHVAATLLSHLDEDVQLTPSSRDQIFSFYRRQILPRIRQLQATATSIPVRRWAAAAAESLWVRLDDEVGSLRKKLQQRATSIRPGRSRWISAKRLGTTDEHLLGRVLAVLAQEDYGFDLRKTMGGFWITRPPVFMMRAWRVLHELRNPATDKRQAFRHTVGRHADATLRVPSQVLAELSQTKVPGEPLFIPEEGGWRPYLPLPDDFLSVLGVSWFGARTVSFYSSEGLTEVRPPRSVWRRLQSWLSLTNSFPQLAKLRNWTADSERGPTEYLETLARLGFRVEYRPYSQLGGRYLDPHQPVEREDAPDTSVSRFFPCIIALGMTQFPATAQRFMEYFRSVYENSLWQLVIFAVSFLVLFLLAHFAANYRLRRARNQIGISLGGWGTRGKSGTERLKAALLSGLGYSYLSKTTGCEAMFLWGEAYGATRELPLFRPLDKATIWEHHDVLRMAARMRCSAFLWECMGLTPSYVDVLQRQWTADDLSTITNAYPDHEDLQGPAGLNVATTIAGFAPASSRLLTSEQQMKPTLASACARAGSSLGQVSWLHSGLLTEDVLERFPYDEHPDNIALVAALAAELGVRSEFALKEMADNLIADLGVLRTYPVATIGTKRLQLTNGMSANERLGCMGNWHRAGFADHSPAEEPGVWISTVVNNRADRVARSKVFATILVEDLRADRHFVIGDNLRGFMSFVWKAWEQKVAEFSLWNEGDSAIAVWLRQSQQMRQATSEEDVYRDVLAMLRGIERKKRATQAISAAARHARSPAELEAALVEAQLAPKTVAQVLTHQAWLLRSLLEYRDMHARIEAASEGDHDSITAAARQLLRTWFERKFVVIDDFHAAGDTIVQQMADETPPGFLNRSMGLQNIKGTGLGFVYQWQTWLDVHKACETIRDGETTRAVEAAETLANFPAYGLLARDRIQETIESLRHDPALRSVAESIDMPLLEARLHSSNAKGSAGARRPSHGEVAGGRLWAWLEDVLDPADGIRRRRMADRIYRDLERSQISVDDAIAELRRLNERQKGGWLKKSVGSWWRQDTDHSESDAEYVERLEHEATDSDHANPTAKQEPVAVS